MDKTLPLAQCQQVSKHRPKNWDLNDTFHFRQFESPDQVRAFAILMVGIRWHLGAIRKEADSRG